MSKADLHSISPIFQVSNLKRGVDFYTQALGFEVVATWGKPPDRAILCHGAVQITLEVERNPTPSQAYIKLDGVDAYFTRAVAAGARIIRPLEDRGYGMRDGRVIDFDGNAFVLGESLVID